MNDIHNFLTKITNLQSTLCFTDFSKILKNQQNTYGINLLSRLIIIYLSFTVI